ncbi:MULTISPECIES: IclR family transcriptional regulator [Paraburkholderia]|uniref:hypothetical protein n=1 Tax=Paraburkholderia TaxID=1822464 RepID=UPI0038B7A98B
MFHASDHNSALDHVAWPKTRRGIEKALDDYHTLGVTTSFGDWQKEVNGIARAFQPGGELPIMAINVGGPSFSRRSFCSKKCGHA